MCDTWSIEVEVNTLLYCEDPRRIIAANVFVTMKKASPKRKHDSEENTCVICMGKPPTHAAVPCGHRCMCEGCASDFPAGVQNKCTVCSLGY